MPDGGGGGGGSPGLLGRKQAAGPPEKVAITFATSERAEEIRRLLEAGPNLYFGSS